ncbi:Gfo/Idh/MocA family oxidoreductase [Candidatus Pelagibacter sp.]|nr:Gfo/Idh/MocA family oxidoreductase [Candidatus Pelagibacter sp.]
MNVGLIGLGYWGKNLLRNLLTNHQIENIYVLDNNLENVVKFPHVKYFNEQKIFFAINKIDIYIISTPTKFHYKYIEKCLSIDKHVCITKPFTTNFNQVKKLYQKFDNTEKIFLDHTYLFHSSIRYIKSVIKKKELGKLIYYDSERISFGKFYNDVDVIDDLAIHDLYILDYLLDGEMPDKIGVNSQSMFGNKNFISTVSLNYPSGFFANIKVSWYSPIKSRRILLAGNKKIIEFDDNESDKKLKIYNKGIEYKPLNKVNQWLYRTGEIEIPNILHQESLTVMINEFIKYSKSTKKNKNIFKHGERVMNILSQIKKKL